MSLAASLFPHNSRGAVLLICILFSCAKLTFAAVQNEVSFIALSSFSPSLHGLQARKNKKVFSLVPFFMGRCWSSSLEEEEEEETGGQHHLFGMTGGASFLLLLLLLLSHFLTNGPDGQRPSSSSAPPLPLLFQFPTGARAGKTSCLLLHCKRKRPFT